MGGPPVLNGYGRSAPQTVLLVRHLHRPYVAGTSARSPRPRVQEYSCSMHYEVGTWEAAIRHMSDCLELIATKHAGAP